MANRPTTKPEELAAPLDLLLVSATRPFASRMMPNATWARFGTSLAKQPGAVASRTATLTRELGAIAMGRSHRVPARADKRFTDPAWQQNPLLHRMMQGYLAAAETADGLLADAQLDWRDARLLRLRAVVDRRRACHAVRGAQIYDHPFLSRSCPDCVSWASPGSLITGYGYAVDRTGSRLGGLGWTTDRGAARGRHLDPKRTEEVDRQCHLWRPYGDLGRGCRRRAGEGFRAAHRPRAVLQAPGSLRWPPYGCAYPGGLTTIHPEVHAELRARHAVIHRQVGDAGLQQHVLAQQPCCRCTRVAGLLRMT